MGAIKKAKKFSATKSDKNISKSKLNHKNKSTSGLQSAPGKKNIDVKQLSTVSTIKNNVNDNAKAAEKPNWMEMKKKKKALRVERRKTKISEEGYEVTHKAKLLGAQLQKKSIKKEVINGLCAELHNLLKDKYYLTFALSHDMSRVIQVLIKHSNEKIKLEIMEKLEPIVFQMAQSKYAHHCVKILLKVGTNLIRQKVIEKFYGHIVSLASHSVSAPILDHAFGEFATQKDKIKMVQEFYGDMYKNSKHENITKLADSYKDSPELKEGTLGAVKANLQKVIGKNLHDGQIFHWVLNDYLNECKEEDRIEMISTLSPLIVPLTNSLPGVNAACTCLWLGSNKDKKTILKVVKEHVVALAAHKYGYQLLLAIFSSIDDTVMVKKTVLSVITTNIRELVKSHSGRKVIHFLVQPFDTSVFHPEFVQALKEGNEKSTSKKDSNVREQELKEAFIPVITEEIVKDPQFWFKDPVISLLTVAIVQSISDSDAKKSVLDAIASVVCDSNWKISKGDSTVNGFEDAGMNTAIKKLRQAEDAAIPEAYTLGAAVANLVTPDLLKLWIGSNRGCFMLISFIENNSKLTAKYKELLKPFTKSLEKQDGQGFNLLMSKLK